MVRTVLFGLPSSNVRFCFWECSILGKKLYVGNLSYSVTNQSLEDIFAEFGAVRSAQVIQDRDTGRSKGFGSTRMELAMPSMV
jgi:hypothetical protein